MYLFSFSLQYNVKEAPCDYQFHTVLLFIVLFIILSYDNCYYFVAIASISSITSFGSLATSTQLLAGKSPSKNVA